MAVAAAIGGAIALGTSIYQGVKARKAKKAAEKLRKEGMAESASAMAEMRKNQKLAEDIRNMGGMSRQEYQTASQNIQRSSGSVLSALRGSRQALAGVGRVQQAADDATAKLDAQNAAIARANRLSGTQSLMQSNAAIAAQRMRNADRDFFGPSQMATMESQALTGAAMQNIGGAAMGALQLGAMGAFKKPAGSNANTTSAPTGVDVVSKYKIPEYRVKVN